MGHGAASKAAQHYWVLRTALAAPQTAFSGREIHSGAGPRGSLLGAGKRKLEIPDRRRGWEQEERRSWCSELGVPGSENSPCSFWSRKSWVHPPDPIRNSRGWRDECEQQVHCWTWAGSPAHPFMLLRCPTHGTSQPPSWAGSAGKSGIVVPKLGPGSSRTFPPTLLHSQLLPVCPRANIVSWLQQLFSLLRI